MVEGCSYFREVTRCIMHVFVIQVLKCCIYVCMSTWLNFLLPDAILTAQVSIEYVYECDCFWWLFLRPVQHVGEVYSNPVCPKVFSFHFHVGLLPTFIGGAVCNYFLCFIWPCDKKNLFLYFLCFLMQCYNQCQWHDEYDCVISSIRGTVYWLLLVNCQTSVQTLTIHDISAWIINAGIQHIMQHLHNQQQSNHLSLTMCLHLFWPQHGHP